MSRAFENTVKHIKNLYKEKVDQLDQEIKSNTAKGKKSYFRGELVEG